ncbi:MAG TPA: hypothetical protein VMW08_19690 [Acidimicrobiales bacterium]|nr:hypothetical protein [Acidimicrobiales bacterium]
MVPMLAWTRRTTGVLAIVALSAFTACGSDDPDVFVVGDSTMGQIKAVTGRGSTMNGCGFTIDAPCLVPLGIDGDPDLIVAAVSVWDMNASEIDVVEGYRNAHAKLSADAPVVWVEVPPLLGGKRGEPTPDQADALNARVAAALGCELIGWEVRDDESDDGIHYVGSGASDVAKRLDDLSDDQACASPG